MSDYIKALNSSSQASTGSDLYSKKKDGSVMGKEDFMMLLVAQLKNQDPLNPDDPTEFTAQLAQFSSLEQLYNLNDSMENLVTSNIKSDRLATLGTIGKDVIFEGKTLKFSGKPVELGYRLSGPASEVTISLQRDGATVATLEGTDLTTGNHFLTWDGLTTDGSAAPVGDYTIVLSAKSGTKQPISVAPLIKSEVTGVDLGGNKGGTLVTKAGSIAFSKILGVFEAGAKINTPSTKKDEEKQDDKTTPDAGKDAADSAEKSAATAQSTGGSTTQ